VSQNRPVYDALAAGSDFRELRRRYLGFVVPATLSFLLWYVAYLICNSWARGLMSVQVIGRVNVAVIFGLLQFVSTFVIALRYARHANRALDPLASKLASEFEAQIGPPPLGHLPRP
jgi:uncharacterized membrane protein (DUF485 family)